MSEATRGEVRIVGAVKPNDEHVPIAPRCAVRRVGELEIIRYLAAPPAEWVPLVSCASSLSDLHTQQWTIKTVSTYTGGIQSQYIRMKLRKHNKTSSTNLVELFSMRRACIGAERIGLSDVEPKALLQLLHCCLLREEK